MSSSARPEARGAAVAGMMLTLQEAADQLKVHYMTAYRWVRSGQLPAAKTGGRIRIRERDLDDFIAARAVQVALPPDEAGRTDWETHRSRLHQLLRDGAGPDAAALARKVVADGASIGDVYVQLIAPALHRIGEDWAAGTITVAEEHRATEIAKAILSRFGDAFRRRGPSRGTVVTLTPPAEEHGLATTMLADFLRAGGFAVHQLGANVPLYDLRMFLLVVPTDVVCASVTRDDFDAAALGELVAVAADASARTVIGGQGVDAALVAGVGATYVDDLTALADVVARLLQAE